MSAANANPCIYFPEAIHTEHERRAVVEQCNKGAPADFWRCPRHHWPLIVANAGEPFPCCPVCRDALPPGAEPTTQLEAVAFVRVSVPVPPAAGGK